MFSGPILLVVTVIFSAIHIAIWHMLPRKMKHIIFAQPVLAFIMDFLGSGLITNFTGVASFVGICNMGASVVFGLYAVGYIVYHGIKGIKIDWYRAFGIRWLPWFPKLMVMYSKDGRSWVE
jgi:hypothetical protein